jgi:hypothetical protein
MKRTTSVRSHGRRTRSGIVPVRKYERNIVLPCKFGLRDMPKWMYAYDSGASLPSGTVDIWVPEKQVPKVKAYFKKKKLKISVGKKEEAW